VLIVESLVRTGQWKMLKQSQESTKLDAQRRRDRRALPGSIHLVTGGERPLSGRARGYVRRRRESPACRRPRRPVSATSRWP
jgi:hypothetical protein